MPKDKRTRDELIAECDTLAELSSKALLALQKYEMDIVKAQNQGRFWKSKFKALRDANSLTHEELDLLLRMVWDGMILEDNPTQIGDEEWSIMRKLTRMRNDLD